MKIYFDNAATTPLHKEVLNAMLPYLSEDYGNPSSIHSYGRKIHVNIEEAREVIAEFINADAGEIYFNSGGTEAINFPILGIAKTDFEDRGKDHIITSQLEHHAVLETARELEKSGFEISFLKNSNDGIIDNESIKDITNPSTTLISLMHVNNETGIINDLRKAKQISSDTGVYFHSDMVQSFGKIKIDVKDFGVDSISASAHKIYGPKGIGFTWVKSGTPLSSLHFGGSQERSRRGGTENVAGIIGLAQAVKIAEKEMQSNYEIVLNLKEHFVKSITSIDNEFITVNGAGETSPYILSITLSAKKYANDAEAMLIYLDINGIAASNGSACSSGTLKPSHVMLGMGKSEADAYGTIRFSFNPKNTIEEVDYTLDILKKMTDKFKKR